MFAHVKLEQVENSEWRHRLTVNGMDFSKNTCRVELDACSIPKVVITMNGAVPEFDGQADVKYDFTPETVQQAIVVMRNELLKHGEFYDGFRASVMSAADYQFCRPDGATCDELVDAIMKRIIGED